MSLKMIIKKQKIYNIPLLKEIKFAFLPVKLHNYLSSYEVKKFNGDIIWLEKYVRYTLLTPLNNYQENAKQNKTYPASVNIQLNTTGAMTAGCAVNGFDTEDTNEYIKVKDPVTKILRYVDAILEELYSCS